MIDISTLSIVIAASGVTAASIYYRLQIRSQTRVRQTDLLMRLYSTWDSLEFQEAWHRIYWMEFKDYDEAVSKLGGKRHIASYVLYFYDEVGALLREKLIDISLSDRLLGNSVRQMWEKVKPVIHEARERSSDPRIYEHFEYLYNEMKKREQQ